MGVDIGCGMIAVRTQFDRSALERRGDLRGPARAQIERAVPLSAGAEQREDRRDRGAQRVVELEALAAEAGLRPRPVREGWRQQLGSLGSGNHFIEVSVDERGPGVGLPPLRQSRGVGNRIAQAHIKVAQALMTKWWIELPDRDLAYLVEGTAEFGRYIAELRWAQRFALLNREEMMDRVVRQLSEHLGEAVVEQERINCHHNFTQQEQHFGKTVWVSRKGAISARQGEAGLIPGSMGTASYVVRGAREPDGARLLTARRGPGLLPVGRAADVHARAAAGGDGRASSSATPTRSWTRSRRRTSRSSRSWPTRPTSSGSGTRCGSSST